ncbi:MAG: AsmA-like C-terminal region-containing protein [Isosphaerales bacterium]
MTSRRIQRFALILCVVLCIPPLLWLGIVLIAPTGWAKGHLVAALEARSGRQVRLERLSVRLFGGIRLTNLEIGSPQSVDDPWLKTADLRLDVSLMQLLLGKLEPTSMAFDGVNLRVLRRADGTLELADFLEPRPESRSPSDRAHRGPAPLVIQIRSGTVTLIDEPSKTRLHLQNVEGEAVREGHRAIIHLMRGMLNGGPFHVDGHLDRTGDTPRFEGRFRAENVVLDDGMSLLRYAVPVLAGAPLNLKGRLNSDLYLHGEGSTSRALLRSLAGHGVIALDPIDLDGAPLVSELSKIADLTRQGRTASIRTDFVVQDQRIATDHLTLDIGRVPMTLSGWTDFDGRIDYQINLRGLNERLPDKARRFLGDLNVNLQSLRMLTLQGSVNQMVVRLNGIALDRDLLRGSGIKREDREKLRVIGRKLLDELVR